MRNKTKFTKHYRHPRTTQERRENGKRRNNWGRAKRNQANLVSAWDDIHIRTQKTWKLKRRHQYRDKSRGTRHTLFLPNSSRKSWGFWIDTWALREYLNSHDIPFCIEDKWNKEERVYTHEYVYTYNKPIPYIEVQHGKNKTQRLIEHEYLRSTDEWVLMPLKKPRITYWCTLLGYKLTWWSDKDIGIEYILQTCSNARNIS